MSERRILVTGPRVWPIDRAEYVAQQCETHLFQGWAIRSGVPTFVWGACPEGVDLMVTEWAGTLAAQELIAKGVMAIYPMPANWASQGRAAGPIRNGAMVSTCTGPHDIALVFLDERIARNRGTRSCLKAIQTAGLNYEVHEIQADGLIYVISRETWEKEEGPEK